MPRLGSALFNADHTRLGEELRRVEAAGIEFIHLDVFDGYAVPDQGFPARTIAALRPLTRLPFEVHLTARDPLRFIPALADAGVDLIFLPAETTPYLYEAIFTLEEKGVRPGVCLALGTSLAVLPPVLAMIDAVLLLGRVTGEGRRGRTFNDLVLHRVATVRGMIRAAQGRQSEPGAPGGDHGSGSAGALDLQVAGGLERDACVEVCRRGATSLPLGSALHRQQDLTAYVAELRVSLAGTPS